LISLEVAKEENVQELCQNKNILEVYIFQLKEMIDTYNPDFDIGTEERYVENFIEEIKEAIDSLEHVLESIKTEYRVKKLLEEIE
jgi:uncharacterized UPF0160 family protein